jgi:predicted metal-dependent peptidase
MYYQRAIYPGQMSEESNHINGVKICIDTSGSISEEDMSRFYYQVCDILKNFEVDAELIFWDAEIYNAGNIKTITEFNRVDCYGGGGTQPRVVFDNFINKKEKPRVILMLTDGFYFDSWDKPEYKRKFKDTIWIMTKNYNKNFNPPFGKLAVAEFID